MRSAASQRPDWKVARIVVWLLQLPETQEAWHGLHELINHMQIKEANILKDKTPFPKFELSIKANVVETSIKDDRSKGTTFQKKAQG